MRINAALKRADGVARRTSAASARAKPPPEAGPRIAAMKGCGTRRIAMIRLLSLALHVEGAGDRFADLANAIPGLFFEIESGAEGASRPAHYDDAAGAVVMEAGDEIVQFIRDGDIERVERMRAVQREPGDGTVPRNVESLIGHGTNLVEVGGSIHK